MNTAARRGGAAVKSAAQQAAAEGRKTDQTLSRGGGSEMEAGA